MSVSVSQSAGIVRMDESLGIGEEEDDDQEDDDQQDDEEEAGSDIMAQEGTATQSRQPRQPRQPRAQRWPLSGPRCGDPSIMHLDCSIGCWRTPAAMEG